MPKLEIHYAQEWAAVYVDGRLDSVGDTYVSMALALELAGVTPVYDDAFMQGQNRRDGVAQTLSEVRAYAAERDHKAARAAALRAEAKKLLDEADGLEAH